MPASAKLRPGQSLFAGSTRSPSFQPPSYYAAANGIPYPRTPLPDTFTASAFNVNEHSDTTHYERFMPVSYLPDPSSSDSSFEFRPTKSHATDGLSTTRSMKREKRQSQITGLPQIEAQLLPSLRDTIDRMTRPPSRLAPPVSIVLERDQSRGANQHHRYEGGDHRSDFSSNAHDGSILLRPRRTLSPQASGSLDKGFSKFSPVATPVSSPFKPAQKSRAGEDRGQDTPRPDSVPEKTSITTPALRSVRSILTRKPSTSSTITASSPESRRRPILKDTPQATKPTAGSFISPRMQQQSVAILCRTPPSKSPDPTNPPQRPPALRQPSQPHRSNIPRLRARFALDKTQPETSDSSDIERQYESARIQQRRLTVINTDGPVPSSSESAGDDHTHPVTPTRPHPGIGLGLNCQFPLPKSPCPETSAEYSYSGSDESIHQAPRSSVTSSLSASSQYSASSEDQESLYESNIHKEIRQRPELPEPFTEDKSQHRPAQLSERSRCFAGRGAPCGIPLGLDSAPRDSDHTHASGSVRSPIPLTRLQPANSLPANPNKSTPKERSSLAIPGRLPAVTPDIIQATHQGKSNRRGKGKIGSAIARLARRSLMVAAREREAFGLRPSDSEEYHQRFENFRHHLPCENHLSESSVTSVSGVPDDALSHGASHLFQSIKAERQPPSNYPAIRGDGSIAEELQRSSTRKAILSSPFQPDSESLRDLSPLHNILGQLLRTEEDFVAIMQRCIQLYVLPLRASGSKAWISGVPSEVSRFLDWFEDILHLHERILDLFRGSQQRVLGEMIQLLPKFEIYQPYFVCVGDFVQRLQCLTNKGDDFGHFVTLQDKQIRHSGWSLLKYIVEPEKRLQKYLDLLSALHVLTPPQDPHFLVIFSLLRSLELIIDVMNTVKQEEERHRILRSLLSRFQGLRSIACLADRNRTLLWHGSVILNLDDEATYRDRDAPQARKTQRLSKAVTAWDTHHGAQPLYSQELQDSFTSLDTASNYSGSTSGSQDVSLSLRDLSNASIIVYAVILSDVLLFGEYSPGSSDSYHLISEIGMTRVFSIQTSDSPSAFLQVIPVDSIDAAPNDVTGPIKGLIVSLSPPTANISSDQVLHQDMFAALRSSAEYTRRFWCRPWKTSKAVDGNNTSRILDSLVGSGLPLPKSPSGRLLETGPHDGDASNQEREERGWWSFRFHQVMSAKRQMVFDSV